MIYIHYTEN